MILAAQVQSEVNMKFRIRQLHGRVREGKLCVKSDRIGQNRRLEANTLYSLAGRSAYVLSRIRSNLRTLFYFPNTDGKRDW